MECTHNAWWLAALPVPLLVVGIACGARSNLQPGNEGAGGFIATLDASTYDASVDGSPAEDPPVEKCWCRTPDTKPWPDEMPICHRRCNGDLTEWYDDCDIVQYVIQCPGTCLCTPPDCSGYVQCV